MLDIQRRLPYDPASSITEQARSSIIQSLDNLRPAVESALESVYLDCLILHTPYDTLEDTLEAWAVFEECVPHTIRSLGISNVSHTELKLIHQRVNIKPSVVQNAFHPKNKYDVEVRRFCTEMGMTYQGFWALTANPELLRSDFVTNLAGAACVDKEVVIYGLCEHMKNVAILNGTKNVETMKLDLEQGNNLRAWAKDEKNSKAWSSAFSQFVAISGAAGDSSD